MSLTQDQLQAVLETCEFDRWLGLSIQSLDESTLTVMLPFRTEIVGTPKIKHLHGGGVASLIDATGCYLLIALLNKRVSTASLVVDYLRPAHGDLVAVARLVKIGSRVCNVTVEVSAEDGKLSATGRLTVVPINMAADEEGHLAEPTGVRGPVQKHGMQA